MYPQTVLTLLGIFYCMFIIALTESFYWHNYAYITVTTFAGTHAFFVLVQWAYFFFKSKDPSFLPISKQLSGMLRFAVGVVDAIITPLVLFGHVVVIGQDEHKKDDNPHYKAMLTGIAFFIPFVSIYKYWKYSDQNYKASGSEYVIPARTILLG